MHINFCLVLNIEDKLLLYISYHFEMIVISIFSLHDNWSLLDRVSYSYAEFCKILSSVVYWCGRIHPFNFQQFVVIWCSFIGKSCGFLFGHGFEQGYLADCPGLKLKMLLVIKRGFDLWSLFCAMMIIEQGVLLHFFFGILHQPLNIVLKKVSIS